MSTLSKRFPAARRYRISAIEQRDLAMKTAREVKSVSAWSGSVATIKLLVNAARAAQRQALTISKAVL